jgi:hypothetical protein
VTQGSEAARVANAVQSLALVLLASCGPELALPPDVPVRPPPVAVALEAGTGGSIPQDWFVAKRCRRGNEVFYPDLALRFEATSWKEVRGHQMVRAEDAVFHSSSDGWTADFHDNGTMADLDADAGSLSVETGAPTQVHLELAERDGQLLFERVETPEQEPPRTLECVLAVASVDETRAIEASLLVIEDPGNCPRAVECCHALGGTGSAHEEDWLSWRSICEKRETSPAYCHLWLVDRMSDAREEGKTLPAQCR